MPIHVQPDALRQFATQSYAALGMPEETAALVADTLVQADMWGHQSHGVMRLFWYGARLESGAMNPNAEPELAGLGGLMTMDGRDGVGQLIALRAMEAAIAGAKKHGIAAVAVRNAGHFGTAMYFTRMAARAGCLGYLCANASPAMAPWGGMKKRIGTNPWSWSAPAGRYAPMMLDIANTAVARGKLYLAKQRGEKIPETWAMDAEGRITTDPAAGIEGTILPMAGHKGYAVATIVDVLSGVLSGSGFGASITGPYTPEGRSGCGHLALVIDIAASRPLAEFEADMERLIEELKATPRQPGVDEIFYPGEIEARNAARAAAEGILLPDATADELRARGAALGVTAPF
ncbi:Ldh family oxidoreductase [Halovulum dunhuangense]|uniref:Ldh family oxidoreductase n=1 Tax=Halovulum dunhuangense TaxID=1505036 RepID=A0A849L242_9RHOB|nr:Ldh family oxidoreductase [Halovulum dunhuangense]NNU80320.1 Ldh family oxidoreductase [Halovulum dunhuangense]